MADRPGRDPGPGPGHHRAAAARPADRRARAWLAGPAPAAGL